MLEYVCVYNMRVCIHDNRLIFPINFDLIIEGKSKVTFTREFGHVTVIESIYYALNWQIILRFSIFIPNEKRTVL